MLRQGNLELWLWRSSTTQWEPHIRCFSMRLFYPSVNVEKVNGIYNGIKTYAMTTDYLRGYKTTTLAYLSVTCPYPAVFLLFSSLENISYNCNSLHTFPKFCKGGSEVCNTKTSTKTLNFQKSIPAAQYKQHMQGFQWPWNGWSCNAIHKRLSVLKKDTWALPEISDFYRNTGRPNWCRYSAGASRASFP